MRQSYDTQVPIELGDMSHFLPLEEQKPEACNNFDPHRFAPINSINGKNNPNHQEEDGRPSWQKQGTTTTTTMMMTMNGNTLLSETQINNNNDINSSNSNRKKTCHSIPYRHHLLISLLVLQSIGVICFLAFVFISRRSDAPSDSKYGHYEGELVIFGIATVFEVYIAIDSLVNRNVPQLLALCVFEGSMTGFAALLPQRINKAVGDHIVLCVPVITGIATLIMLSLTWFFYKEFGWQLWKKLGADIEVNRAMKIKSIFFLLQKFNFFFLMGSCVLLFQWWRGSEGSVETMGIIIPLLVLFVVCCILLFASIAVELELSCFLPLYVIFWICAVSFTGYVVYELINYWEPFNSLILFPLLTFVLLFSTGIIAILCHKNFNKGLKNSESSFILGVFKKKSSSKNQIKHSNYSHVESGDPSDVLN